MLLKNPTASGNIRKINKYIMYTVIESYKKTKRDQIFDDETVGIYITI